ncbi:MAG: biotin/lipoyl-containing protein, partial [bacterium]
MPTNVIMPALGMAQETGKVLRWLKGEGETVAKGEPLLEVETDKATVELEAPAAGILTGVTASAGDVVPVGRVIAAILAPGESRAQPAAPPRSTGMPAPAGAPAPPPATPAAEEVRSASAPAHGDSRRVAASP